MRVILYTGKGGVGKTSIAAATALRAAERGYRTVVLSTDAAHSLADSFDVELSPVPRPIAPNLWAQEIDVLHQIDMYWGVIQEWMKALAAWRGVDDIVADEVAVLPGMEELASLLQILYLADADAYDVVIVDCAPTGETLRLLGFPEVARWWLERVFPWQRRTAQLVRPVMRGLMDLPVPGDDVFAAVERLFRDLARMRVLLADPEISSVRLVVNPEKMVIKEAQRTFAYLNLFGYSIDLVAVNRVLEVTGNPLDDEGGERPEEALAGELRMAWQHWRTWVDEQLPYLRLIDDSFAPVPIRRCRLFDREVVGFARLREMAASLYGEDDPTRVFHRGLSVTVERVDGTYVMTLPLPLVDKGRVELTRTGDEMVVRIGNQRRNLVLPRALAALPTQEAKLEDGALRITFAVTTPGGQRD